MATCSVCGGDNENAFIIEAAGETYIFDTLDCAIQALAPKCANCGCRILGYAVEVSGKVFCCANCASNCGDPGLRDRSSELLSAPLAPLI
jgi:hypothetical protein